MLLQLKAYEENARRHAFGKGKALLIDFSGNCGSSSIQRENLNKRKFVKRLVIKIENPINEHFLVCYIKIHWSFLPFEWIF